MAALRNLSAIYLMSATAFTAAIVLDQNPPLKQAATATVRFAGEQTGRAAVALNRSVIQPGWRFASDQTATLVGEIESLLEPAQPSHVASTAPKKNPVVVAKREAAPMEKKAAQTKTPELRPAIPEAIPPVAANERPKLELAPQTPKAEAPSVAQPPVAGPPPNPVEIARVAQRLRDSLTPEMADHFDLFLYVSKAERGPWAQHMYVYQKQADGNLRLLYNWPVSTGREKDEYTPAGIRAATDTPQGYYQLDPERFYMRHHSGQWDQPMPYSMFFTWVKNGYQTGLAIHGAGTADEISLLGSRASAGCVRIAPENARLLFDMIRADYKGLVPKFAYDKKTATMSNDGVLLHDRDGHLELQPGYKVLVFIENYGGSDIVAALF